MTAFLSLATTSREASALSKELTMTHTKHRYWKVTKAHSMKQSGLCSNFGKRISKIGAKLREKRQGWLRICSKLACKITKIFIKTSTKGRILPILPGSIHLSPIWFQASLCICRKCNLDQEVIKIGLIRFMEINLMASLPQKLQVKCTTCHKADRQGLPHMGPHQKAHLFLFQTNCRWMARQTLQKQKTRLLKQKRTADKVNWLARNANLTKETL